MSPRAVLTYVTGGKSLKATINGKSTEVAITNRRRLTEKLQLYAGIEDKDDVPPVTLAFEREDDTSSGELKLFVPNKQLNRGPLNVNVALFSHP